MSRRVVYALGAIAMIVQIGEAVRVPVEKYLNTELLCEATQLPI